MSDPASSRVGLAAFPYAAGNYRAMLEQMRTAMASVRAIQPPAPDTWKDASLPQLPTSQPTVDSYASLLSRLKELADRLNNPKPRPQPAAPAAPPVPSTPAPEAQKPTVPPAPPAPPAPPPQSNTYTVQSGDSLSRIAQRQLGNGNRWREIFDANRDQLSDPDRILPGQVLKMPGAGGQPAPQPQKPTVPPAPPAPPPRSNTYTVQSGDSLSRIAQRQLGDGNRWREIFDANRDQLSDPNRIVPGQVLKMPGAGGQPAPQPPSGPTGGGSFPLGTDAIARTLGVPAENVRRYWPHLAEALKKRGLTSKNAIIAALATIKTEVGSFAPIPEYASGAAYEGRSDLGNTQRGDGVRYKGRGFIQLTGRANYSRYGSVLGVNLVGNPDLALDPRVASEVLAEYMAQRGIGTMANQGDWRSVRRAVNGGYNGWDTFIGAVNRLKAAVG